MIWAIVMVFFVPVCLRAIWISWRQPLQDRPAGEWEAMSTSVTGIPSPTTTLHTRLRTNPVGFVWLLFLMYGATLQIEHIHVPALEAIEFAGLGLIGALLAAVAMFNRPRWAVPPALRGQRGLIRLAGEPEQR